HYMVMGLLPTPTAVSDAKGGAMRKNPKRQNDTLAHAIHGMSNPTGKTSQLNHRFVMEMMGYPPDWCDLPSKPEGTPSSRKSHTKYSKQLKEVSIKEEEGNG